MKQDSFFYPLKLTLGFAVIVTVALLIGGCGSLVRVEYQNGRIVIGDSKSGFGQVFNQELTVTGVGRVDVSRRPARPRFDRTVIGCEHFVSRS